MSGADESQQLDGSTSAGADPTSASGSGAGVGSSSQSAPAAPAPAKRRMVISHDKYITLKSLIILHLSKVETETGQGLDRDDLIDWYLETKEEEGAMQDIEDIEHEKELVVKMLRKLVKVCVESLSSGCLMLTENVH